jgi:hypothetical protein
MMPDGVLYEFDIDMLGSENVIPSFKRNLDPAIIQKAQKLLR